MIKELCIYFFVFTFLSLQSQNSDITGIVVDAQNQKLEMVSAAILKSKDSSFVNYTTTDVNGVFSFNNVAKDTLILQLNSLGFKPYFKKFIFDGSLIDFKTIILQEDISTLDEVVISAVLPVQVKKDTIRFSASALKVNHDDNIESLLKKIPDIDIDETGRVIAKGTTISKIFVDGKEFFGSDPSIVLKNLSADAISKIEIIDKKSEEEELTGVSDGNKQVIINLTLKKTKKTQGFGKFAAGIGLDSRYFTNANYNKFSPKSQLAVIGKFNNINVTGASIQSFLENSHGISESFDDEDDEDLKANNRALSGFLTTSIAGANYGVELKKKKTFNTDYFYNYLDNAGISTTERVNFTNLNNFNYTSENNYRNTSNNHAVNFNLENKSNKKSVLLIKGLLQKTLRDNYLKRDGSFFNENNELITLNNNKSENSSTNNFARLNGHFLRRLKKRGQFFSFNFTGILRDNDRENNQEVLIVRNVNKANESIREIFTDRMQKNSSGFVNFIVKYRQPIVDKHFLVVESTNRILDGKDFTAQERTIIRNTTEQSGFDFNFKFFEISNRTKLAYSYNNPKLNISFANEYENLRRVFGNITNNDFVRENTFFNPSFFIRYRPKKGQTFRLSYNRNIRPPRSYQINPFVNDINPFFITTGNPNLEVEKVNNFLAIFNVFNHKSAVTFNGRLQYQLFKDAIIRNVEIDDDFVRTTSFSNSGDKEVFKGRFGLNHKLKSLNLRYSFRNSYQFNKVNSIVNFTLNNVVSDIFDVRFVLENFKKKRFDAKIGANYNINTTRFSIETDLNRSFARQTYFGSFDMKVNKKINFNTQLDYIIYTDNLFSVRQEIPLWNASLSYFITPKNHILKLVLIDALNRNIDIQRRSTLNFFEETTLQNLGRYVIISYSYKIGTGKRNKKKKR